VRNIPARLLITALHRADATFPPAVLVRMTHILTVVGRHIIMRTPSRREEGKKFGTNARIAFVKGLPTRKGHAVNDIIWISRFNFKFDAALASWDNSSDRPESE